MAQLNFDASQVKPSTGTNDPVPAAWYNAAIVASEIKPTSKGDGTMLCLTFSILDGLYANRKIFVNLNIRNANPVAQEIAYADLSAICAAVGLVQVPESELLHNRPLKIKVKVRPAKGEYEASNAITSYKNINEKVDMSLPATAGVPMGVQQAQQQVVVPPQQQFQQPVQQQQFAQQQFPQAQQQFQQPVQQQQQFQQQPVQQQQFQQAQQPWNQQAQQQPVQQQMQQPVQQQQEFVQNPAVQHGANQQWAGQQVQQQAQQTQQQAPQQQMQQQQMQQQPQQQQVAVNPAQGGIPPWAMQQQG
jgi:hypothetical protein